MDYIDYSLLHVKSHQDRNLSKKRKRSLPLEVRINCLTDFLAAFGKIYVPHLRHFLHQQRYFFSMMGSKSNQTLGTRSYRQIIPSSFFSIWSKNINGLWWQCHISTSPYKQGWQGNLHSISTNLESASIMIFYPSTIYYMIEIMPPHIYVIFARLPMKHPHTLSLAAEKEICHFYRRYNPYSQNTT